MALEILGQTQSAGTYRNLEYLVGLSGTWFRQDPNGVRMDSRKRMWFHSPREERERMAKDRTRRGNSR